MHAPGVNPNRKASNYILNLIIINVTQVAAESRCCEITPWAEEEQSAPIPSAHAAPARVMRAVMWGGGAFGSSTG